MITIALLSLLVAAPNLCSPSDDPVLRARIEPLLGTIHRPTDPQEWRRLPQEARAVLEAIAADPREFATHRAAALAGVEALGGDGSLHERLAADRSVPYLVRFHAVRGLGELLPPERRGGALLPLLRDDPDRRIRAAAAEALAGAAPADGCPAVRAQAQREGADARFAFQRALSACEGK